MIISFSQARELTSTSSLTYFEINVIEEMFIRLHELQQNVYLPFGFQSREPPKPNSGTLKTLNPQFYRFKATNYCSN